VLTLLTYALLAGLYCSYAQTIDFVTLLVAIYLSVHHHHRHHQNHHHHHHHHNNHNHHDNRRHHQHHHHQVGEERKGIKET
jgi:hypothetical protein